MAKGRPADPTRAKRGTGNRPLVGQKAAKEVVVFDEPQLPEPPSNLTETGKAMFRRVVDELAGRGYRDSDLAAVELLCVSYERFTQAREALDKYGLVLRGTRGIVMNPLIRVEKDSAATYLRFAEQLGLTPAARLRLGLMQIAGQSMLASLNSDLDRP